MCSLFDYLKKLRPCLFLNHTLLHYCNEWQIQSTFMIEICAAVNQKCDGCGFFFKDCDFFVICIVCHSKNICVDDFQIGRGISEKKSLDDFDFHFGCHSNRSLVITFF